MPGTGSPMTSIPLQLSARARVPSRSTPIQDWTPGGRVDPRRSVGAGSSAGAAGGGASPVRTLRSQANMAASVWLVRGLSSLDGCSGRESNPHALRRQYLKLVCLPFHHPSGPPQVSPRRPAQASLAIGVPKRASSSRPRPVAPTRSASSRTLPGSKSVATQEPPKRK